VAEGFGRVVHEWGGIDLLVVNAGVAHVSSLADMEPEALLHVLSEAARHFRNQNTGGDIVLISTKNVFAPGAKFSAYSATKAAAHQLARIASLELAEIGVRVNMVSPDAVFSHGARKSGLWAEPGRTACGHEAWTRRVSRNITATVTFSGRRSRPRTWQGRFSTLPPAKPPPRGQRSPWMEVFPMPRRGDPLPGSASAASRKYVDNRVRLRAQGAAGGSSQRP